MPSPTFASARRASEDEIGVGVATSGVEDWEKGIGGIHVTRTFEVERKQSVDL